MKDKQLISEKEKVSITIKSDMFGSCSRKFEDITSYGIDEDGRYLSIIQGRRRIFINWNKITYFSVDFDK